MPNPPSRRGALRRVGDLVTGEVVSLLRRYPVDPAPTVGTVLRLVGLYTLAALLLWLVRFHSLNSYVWCFGPGEGTTWGYWRRVWWALFTVGAFGFPLTLYARYVLGVRFVDLGLRLKGQLRHLPLYVAFVGIVMPFVTAVSFLPRFQKTYPMAPGAGDSLGSLLLWEAPYALQFLAVEMFFRGALLFGPARTLGPWAALVAMLPYVMIHFTKPAPEALGSIVAGLALGWAALRSRSIVPGFGVHVTVAISMDLLALWHKGGLGPG